jgi:hypothetical protein
MAMAEKSKSADAAQATHSGTAYRDMTGPVKFRWILKLIACVISFGFIFPNVMLD